MKLYVKTWCPWCVDAIDWLKRHGYHFEQIDVLASDAAYKRMITISGQRLTPTLELDNGNYLSEITAICEYLEEKYPNPPLIGTSPEERAECRMWTRRVDLNICEHMGNGYRFGEALKFFEKRIPCAPEASPGLKMIAANRLQWLNGQMADGRDYLCGKRFALADILLYGWLDFAATVGQPLDTANTNIVAWMARVGERPSAKA